MNCLWGKINARSYHSYFLHNFSVLQVEERKGSMHLSLNFLGFLPEQKLTSKLAETKQYTVKKYCKFYNKNAGSQSAKQSL